MSLVSTKGKIKVLNIYGLINNLQGNNDSAIKYHMKASKLAQKNQLKKDESDALAGLAKVFIDLEDFDNAKKYLHQSISIDLLINDYIGLISSLNNLGVVYRKLHKWEIAKKFHQRSLKMANKHKFVMGVSSSLGNIGIVTRLRFQFDLAVRYHKFALQLANMCGDPVGISTELIGLGNALFLAGNVDEGKRCFEKALHICKEIGYYEGEMVATKNLFIFNFLGDSKKLSDLLKGP